jgi:hypothetical protein
VVFSGLTRKVLAVPRAVIEVAAGDLLRSQ